MEERVSIILKEEDQESLDRLKEYFKKKIGIKLTRTALIRHCISERMKTLFPSE